MTNPLFPGEVGNRANYRGDVAAAVMEQREPFGPDLHGALYSPVSATYDAAASLTRVQFRPIPRSDRSPGESMPEELPPLTRQQRRQYGRLTKKAALRHAKRGA